MMDILNLGDNYDEMLEVYVSLNDKKDTRVIEAKKVDGEDYNSTCYMAHVFYNENKTITGMTLSYIPVGGGFHELCALEKNSQEWNSLEKYITENRK